MDTSRSTQNRDISNAYFYQNKAEQYGRELEVDRTKTFEV